MTASTVSRRTCWRALAALAFAPLPVLARERIPAGAVDVRSFGAKGDGVTDDSDALARAHNSGAAVFYPRTDAYYRVTRATKIRGSALSDGATLRQIQDGSTGNSFFEIQEESGPVTVAGFALEGQPGSPKTGEWSMGIVIRGASDVTIKDNIIKNMSGDCIYVGPSKTRRPSRNISIVNNQLMNPFRCNIAIVCGEHVTIRENFFRKSNSYVCAIDLEPNRNGSDFIRNVAIVSNTFDVQDRFISAGVNNRVPNTGLVVTRNRGRARTFLEGYANALLFKPQITKNTFASNRPDGYMFRFIQVRDAFIALNKDITSGMTGYKSLRLRDTTATLTANQFH
jgi:hypothetical protein